MTATPETQAEIQYCRSLNAEYGPEQRIAVVTADFARRLEAERDALREALQMLYDETVDYLTLNHLGDPHHNQSMKLAHAALSRKSA